MMDSERGKLNEMHDGRLLEKNAIEPCSIVKLIMLSAGLSMCHDHDCPP